MVSLSRVTRVILMGNTYPNKDAIRATGAKFDNGSMFWMLNVEHHPMNNIKQRKKLEAALTALEERGVQVVCYFKDASEA